MDWVTRPDYIHCDDCAELYREQPPCDSCAFPQLGLEGAEARAWELWRQLSYISRPRGLGLSPIPVVEMKALCDALNEETNVFEWILEIEQLAYPKLLESQETREEEPDA